MLSIIWNITNRCPYNCSFCVMDAGMNCTRGELSLGQKLAVVKNLRNTDCRVDLSGGEVMLNRKEHLPLIKELSSAIGRDRLGISCSGAFIGEEEAEFLSRYTAGVEMTMDAHPMRDFPRRPVRYHAVAGRAADLLVAKGVTVGLQTVITRDHLNKPWLLDELHGWLTKHRVSEWSLLRFFPAGRGVDFTGLELSDAENLTLVNRAKSFRGRPGSPKIDVHYLMPGTEKNTDCRCVRKSVGILPNGDVTACFWGLNGDGEINNGLFYLGNAAAAPMTAILNGENARYWAGYCGGCPLTGKGGDTDVHAA